MSRQKRAGAGERSPVRVTTRVRSAWSPVLGSEWESGGKPGGLVEAEERPCRLRGRERRSGLGARGQCRHDGGELPRDDGCSVARDPDGQRHQDGRGPRRDRPPHEPQRAEFRDQQYRRSGHGLHGGRRPHARRRTEVASLGDTLAVGPPPLPAGLSVSAFVPSAGTVTVRLCNVTVADIDPGVMTYRVDVWKH